MGIGNLDSTTKATIVAAVVEGHAAVAHIAHLDEIWFNFGAVIDFIQHFIC